MAAALRRLLVAHYDIVAERRRVANRNIVADITMRVFGKPPPLPDPDATPSNRPMTRAYLDEIALQLHFEMMELTRNVQALQPFASALKWVPVMCIVVMIEGAVGLVLLAARH